MKNKVSQAGKAKKRLSQACWLIIIISTVITFSVWLMMDKQWVILIYGAFIESLFILGFILQNRLYDTALTNSIDQTALSAVIHEINNPLSIITGYAGKIETLAKNDKLSNEIALKSSAKITETCLRVAQIAQKLKTSPNESNNQH